MKSSPSKYELANRSGNTTRYTNGEEPMYSVYSSNPRSQLQKFLATTSQVRNLLRFPVNKIE